MVTKSVGITARDGLPPRHWAVVASAWRYAVGSIAITGTIAVVVCRWAIRDEISLGAAALALAPFAFAVLSGPITVWAVTRHVSLMTYYERKVGEVDTWLAGRAAVRALRPLDAMAIEAGVRPLSEFGFADDLAGESVVWHDPREGRTSVAALLKAVEIQPERVADPLAVADDLRRIGEGLDKAAALGISFCFLIRHGDSTNGMEWESRIGSAF